jgi:hypothetical protein
MAARRSRRESSNRRKNPKSTRSAGRRLGARCRSRCKTKSRCFKSRLSARTTLVPRLPSSIASRARRCTSKTTTSLIIQQLGQRLTPRPEPLPARPAYEFTTAREPDRCCGAPELRIRHVQVWSGQLVFGMTWCWVAWFHLRFGFEAIAVDRQTASGKLVGRRIYEEGKLLAERFLHCSHR